MIFPKEPKVRHIENELSDNHIKEWGTLGTHDPSIFKDGDYYYVFMGKRIDR